MVFRNTQETGAGRLLWASEEGQSVKELLRPKDGQRKAERSGNTPPWFAEGKPLTLWMGNQTGSVLLKEPLQGTPPGWSWTC